MQKCRLYPVPLERPGAGCDAHDGRAAWALKLFGYICGGANNAALIDVNQSQSGTSVRHGVRVVGVNPGLVDTERMQYLRNLERSTIPEAGRAARPDEVSGAVAFLASDRASCISGALLTIDGGLVARAGGRGDMASD